MADPSDWFIDDNTEAAPAEELACALIVKAQAGDVSAFEALVCRYYTRILWYAKSLCRDTQGRVDKATAEDIAQTTFIKAWRGLPNVVPGSGIKAWLYRIAQRTAWDWWRDHPKHRSIQWDPRVHDALRVSGRPDRVLMRREVFAEVMRVLHDRLKPRQREALLLYYCAYGGGRNLEVAAAELGLTTSALKSLLHRARSSFQKEWAREYGTEAGNMAAEALAEIADDEWVPQPRSLVSIAAAQGHRNRLEQLGQAED